VPFTDNKGNL
jgi:L-iditol 2-dehydrogenase